MRISTIIYLATLFIVAACMNDTGKHQLADAESTNESSDPTLTKKEQLGKRLFFEASLSTPEGQACSQCHDPAVAFADPIYELPVSRGAVHGMYGNRNDMPVSYSAYVPPLHKDEEEDIWVGGLFWDGRVNSLEAQSQGPPLNPIEMANPDTATIADKLRALPYANLFEEIYGPEALMSPASAYNTMADAIAAYERTPEVNPFSSKYDHWLRGKAEFTEQEQRGFALFVAEDKGNCAACHPNTSTLDNIPALFTDFTYDNLGTPKNPENPYYALPPEINPDGYDYVDLGLGITVNDPAENGKFRVPTLRNIAITSPYMHNGVFKTLFSVMAFYNTRDVADWPDPEVPENVNMDELGNLGLTNQELEDIVAFLNTLTDGWNKNQN
jgi:cytochrome c peroxidase